MNVSSMIQLLESYVDDVVDVDFAVAWFNAGLNRMAVEVQANFPQLTRNSDLSDTPIIDEKYHETIVLYAAAMQRGADGSRMEKDSLLQQFYLNLSSFSGTYSPPMQYRDDDLTQQFVADTDQTVFTITKNEYAPLYSRLEVYIDGTRTNDFTKEGNTFTLTTPQVFGAKVTALWEIHEDYNDPPYPWARSW